MAGEFHYNLGRDADGEHEADEGLAAAVGADFAVFGDGDVVSASFKVCSFIPGLIRSFDGQRWPRIWHHRPSSAPWPKAP